MTDSFSIKYAAVNIATNTIRATYTLQGLDATTGLTFQYLGDQGFGLAPLHRITTRGPLQHGDSDIDFRLDPRVLQLPLMVVNSSATPRYQHYEIREKLLDMFRPGESGIIYVGRGNGTTTKEREIKVKLLGGLSFDVDPNAFHVRTVVQLRADDPTWYDADATYQITYNQAQFGTTQTATNGGNWLTFPQIYFKGAVTNFRITNATTGLFIQYNGAVSSGITIDINLAYGKKTVTNFGTGANLIANISNDSSLATFALQPGANSITVTGTGLDSLSSCEVRWLNRYTGI
jgi:hypothetical protein